MNPSLSNDVDALTLDPLNGVQDAFRYGDIDSSGNFTISGLLPGNYSLDFRFMYSDNDCQCNLAMHQYWGGGNSELTATFGIEVGDGQAVTLPETFTPHPDGAISGKIVDESGNPLYGEAVAYEDAGSSDGTLNLVSSAQTHADGTYTMPHIPNGAYKIGFVVNYPLSGYDTFTGKLGPSSPFVSQWLGDYPTFATGDDVDVDGLTATGVDAVMGFGFISTTPAGMWDDEIPGASNPAEPNCQCGHGDPVNSSSGAYYATATDLEIPGAGPDFAVSRSYSSAEADTDGAFGFGWSSLLDSRIKVIDSGDPGASQPHVVAVVQPDGSAVEFINDGSGNYAPASPRVQATLSLNFGSWTYVLRKTQSYQYDLDGNFETLSDLNGNSIAATYDDNPDEISTLWAGDRSFSFTWTDGHVTEIADSAGRTVSYSYDSASNLQTAVSADLTSTTYGYDSEHQLTTETLPGAATTTNVYSSHRVTSQTDPIGRTTNFDYNDSTHETTVTKPDGSKIRDRYFNGVLATETVGADTAAAAVTYFTYDSANNLVRKSDPLGNITGYKYDNNGNCISETTGTRTITRSYDAANQLVYLDDAAGITSNLRYDSHENLTQITHPGGKVESWTRNIDGTPATYTDPDGKQTTYTYDDAGRLTSTTDALGHSTAVTYDDAGHVLTATDGDGNVTTFTVDAMGRNLTSEDPNNHTTTYGYDARGNLTSVTDPDTHTTTTAYDLANERTSVIDANGKQTSYTYTGAGALHTTTDPDGNVTTDSYDTRGDLLSVKDANNHTTTYVYDLDNHRTQTTLPGGEVSSATYDQYGMMRTSTDALGKVTNYTYDGDGRVAWIADPLNRETDYYYDWAGRTTEVVYPNGAAEHYTYDGRGNLTDFENADSQDTTYAYDDGSRLTSKTEPGGITTSYTYDDADRTLTTTRPDGSVETNTYDDAGQLKKIHESTSGSVDTTYTYDAAGKQLTMTDATGTSTYTYSARGQLLTAQNGNGQLLSYGYDDAGRETSIVYPGSRTVSYLYDPAGNMASVTDWNSKTTSYTWTADNQLNTQTGPDTIVSTHLYDADGQATSITDKKGSTQVAKYGYSYDAAGQLTGDTLTDPTTTSLAHTYTYDAVTQLKSSKTGSTTSTYTETPAGEVTKTANKDTYSYNAKQELTTLTPSPGTATTFAYNDNGDRTSATTSGSSTTMTYAADGSLASVVVPGTSGGTVTYTTDGDGLRQSRTKSGTTTQFLWDSNASLPRMLYDGSQWYVYGADRSPIAQIDHTTNTPVYLHDDLVGTVRLLTTAAGATAGATQFDAFGKRGTHTGTSDSAIGYAGSWTDPTSGYVYMQARDYDPKTSQFIQRDPAVNTTHQPYAYVGNNPLETVDPTGLCVGMDGTPQDRACNSLDFFYSGLGSSIAQQFQIANAGFSAGSTFGIGLLTNNDAQCYGSNPEFWVEFGLGALVSFAGVVATAGTVFSVGGGVGASEAAATGGARFVTAADGTTTDLVGSRNAISLGHYPEYVDSAQATGAKTFSIDDNSWNAMSSEEQLARNQAFLDQAIANKSEIELATPPAAARAGSGYEYELSYLQSKGYVFVDGGTKMVYGG